MAYLWYNSCNQRRRLCTYGRVRRQGFAAIRPASNRLPADIYPNAHRRHSDMRQHTNVGYSAIIRHHAPRLRRLAVVLAMAWALLAATPALAQTTIERWVDATNGSDHNNCTRIVEEGEEEGDPDIYTYKSCATLQRAIAVANPGDVIRVAGGTYAGPITVVEELTLIGGYVPGFGPIIEPPTFPAYYATISGGGVPVQITAGFIITPTTVTLRGLKVTAGSGGGVRVQGMGIGPLEVTLENMDIHHNANAANGGGVAVTGSQTKLSLLGSTVRNNSATSSGGGVYAGGSAQMELGDDTVVSSNSAPGGSGGGVAVSGALTVTLGGITITTNSAANGGGLYTGDNRVSVGADTVIQNNTATSNGGGVYLTGNSAALASAVIRGNTATSGSGGGIYVSGGAPVLDSLELVQNSAANGGGLYAAASAFQLGNSTFLSNTTTGSGGGFYITGGSGMAVTGATLRANRAPSGSGGGGYLTGATNLLLQGATFSGNSAGSGGGLYVQNGQGALAGNTATGNTATNGGGLYLAGSANLAISGLTLSENSATGSGGGLYATGSSGVGLSSPSLQDNLSTGSGAGLYATGSTLVITGSALLQGNVASGQGGGGFITGSSTVSFENLDLIGNAGSDGAGFYADGGALRVSRSAAFLDNQATGNGGALNLTGGSGTSLLDIFAQGNKATAGGAFYAANGTFNFGDLELVANEATAGSGGGGYLTGATLTLTGTVTLRENKAKNDGGGLYATASNLTLSLGGVFADNLTTEGDGGGLYQTTGAATLNVVEFAGNAAYSDGGGVYASGATLALLTGSSFTSNSALTGKGGGLYMSGAALVLGGVAFQTNEASGRGGGLYYTGPSLTLQSGTTLAANKALDGSGGGVAVESVPAVVITGVPFAGNTASADGGGLYADNSGVVLQNAASFTGNAATPGRGGGLFVNGGSLALTGITVASNQAGAGGGLYVAGTPAAVLTGVSVTDNTSTGLGGGAVFNTSTAALVGATLRGNQAGGEGGGLYALHSRVGMTNTLVVRNRLVSTTTYAAGIYAGNSDVRAAHVTIADNSHNDAQGSAGGVHLPAPIAAAGGPAFSTLTLVNSLVSGQDVGVNVLAGNTAVLDTALWNNRAFDWTGAGAFTVTAPWRGDPRFANASGGDYRIRRDSAAFDRGRADLVAAVPTDINGVVRPRGFGPDLGAHEHNYAAGLYLSAGMSPAFVRTGDTVVITLRVLNQSGSTASDVYLRASLPTQLPAPSMVPGACQGIFCEAYLGTLAPGADVTVQINATVTGAPSAAGLVNLLTSITLSTGNFSDSDKSAAVRASLQGCLAEHNGTLYTTVQAAVNAAAAGDTVRVSGACGDRHTTGGPGQLLTLDKSITVQGGWNSAFTVRDTAATPTYLDAAGLGRVVYINDAVAPTLDGLVLRNGSAARLGGGPAGWDAGGGLYINGAAPVLRQVDITTNSSPDIGGGVYLNSASTAAFTGGFVRNNSAGAAGGGLYVYQSAPLLTGVTVSGNTARGGGGLYLNQSAAQLIDPTPRGTAPTCRIDANTATGFPRYVPGAPPVLWLAPGGGGGIVFDRSPATLDGCAVNGNFAQVGGGVYIHASAATVQNSLITANRANTGARVGPGGVTEGDGGGALLDNLDPATLVFRGNLLGSNEGSRGSGLLARIGRSGNLALPHLTVHKNLGGTALVALGESRLDLTDTIVASNAGGPAIFAQNGAGGQVAAITLDRTLWYPPGQTQTGTANGGSVVKNNDFAGDPAFRNDGVHLKRISAAYGVGATDAAFADRDGHARPIGANRELGADEYATAVTVRYVAVNGPGSAPCTDYRNPCGSLQTAIDAAGTGDLIKMAGGAYSGVNSLGSTTQYARLDKTLTIQGGYFPRTDTNAVTDGFYTLNDWEDPHPSENPTVIDVAVQGRAFFITGPISPTLAYLTLRRGSAAGQGGAGGAIYVDGATPNLRDLVVEESLADSGAALYLRQAGGTVERLTLEDNTATRGGGVYVEGGQPVLSALTVQANDAITGAGVYLDNSFATLRQSTLRVNGSATTLDGGGLFVVAGAGTVLSNTVSSNQAVRGGGIGLLDSAALLQGNTIRDNIAGQAAPPAGIVATLGGGVHIRGGAPTLTGNTITANQAVHPGAAYGGGGYLASTAATLTANTVTDNLGQLGGGLYVTAATGATLQANLIRSNQAITAGGGLYLDAAASGVTTNTIVSNRAVDGGGLYLAGSGGSALSANIVISNTADRNGGGLYLNGSNADLQGNVVRANRTSQGRGGGLYATGGVATLTRNLFDANVAPLAGGGLYLQQDGSTLNGDTVQANHAGDGGGVYLDGPVAGASQPAPRLEQVTVSNNIANNSGGGIFLLASAATLHRNIVSGNQATVHGGGLYLEESAPAAFTGNVVRANQAAELGGGLYLGPGTTGRFASNVVAANQAPDGGGIYAAGSTPVLVHTTFTGNGRGLIAAPLDGIAATVILSNTIFAGHSVGVQANTDAAVYLFTTLWDANLTDYVGPGGVVATGDIAGAAEFTADGFHLSTGSAAVGLGLTGDVAAGSDLDGENRFQGSGPELGADELPSPCAAIVGQSAAPVYTTLQDAINSAPSGGEVRVAGTCTGVTAADGGVQLARIAKDLTVRGGYSTQNWQLSLPTTQPTVLDAAHGGRVLVVAGSVRVTLAGLTLINGDAAGQGDGPGGADAGGNLWIDAARITLDGVTLVNGAATAGGGLYLKAGAATVTGATVTNNRATGPGGGVYLDAAADTVQLRDSVFSGNLGQDGGALYVAGGGSLVLGNEFVDNTANLGQGHGGGVYLAGGSPVFSRNRLDANRAADGGGVYVAGGAATVTNNIFAANTGVTGGSGLTVADTAIDVRHNTLVANLGAGAGLLVAGSNRVVSVTNTIFVGHATGLRVAAGNRAILRADLWYDNDVNWSGNVTANANNLFVDPLFADAAAGDYRIVANSPAIDQAINVNVANDVEGQTRPGGQGYDIGADEYLNAGISATLNALPNPVAAGEQQTYIAQVVNTGDTAVVVTIRLTLPAAATPVGPVLWENVTIGRGEVWSTNVVATIATGFAGTLAAALAADGEGVSASATVETSAADISGAVLDFSGESVPDPVAAGQPVEFALRLENLGAVPLHTRVRGQLPAGLTTTAATVWTPVIAGPDGLWTTKFTATVAPTVTTDLVSTFVVTSVEGVGGVYSVTTKLARPAIVVTRVPTPSPARSGGTLRYVIAVTNTGNLALDLTIANTYPAQTALTDLHDAGDWTVTLDPGAVYRRTVTTTVEAGYSGSLAGGVVVSTATGGQVAVTDKLKAVNPTLKPSASAVGGNWYSADSWDPPGVPDADATVVVPEGVTMFSQRPIVLSGLINRGVLELRNPIGGRQAMTVTGVFQNEGKLAGADATTAGGDGISVDLTAGTLLNQGTICGGNGLADGGRGGDLVVTAAAVTTGGLFCGGDGANVTHAAAGIPGGDGGHVILSVDPGLLANTGQILGGAGGNSHPGSDPAQPGGDGGQVTILSASAARLAASDVRGGVGGAGSTGAATGATGGVYIAAPVVNTQDTRFGDSVATVVSGGDSVLDFVAVGPGVLLRQEGSLLVFGIRIFNRGSLADTYIVTPLATPTGWEVNNLPGTVTIGGFHAGAMPVALTIPVQAAAQLSASAETFTIVVTSQRNGANQAVIPLSFVTSNTGAVMQLPVIHR